jgi:mannose-6-phosphate isomerase-like protein (cupin superfamily)
MKKKISIENAEHYSWGDNCDGWHLVKNEILSVIRENIPPGKSETKHRHEISRQFFYILEGEAVIELEERTVTLSSGEGLEIPPGTVHTFRNDSTINVSFLVISSPASHGDRINNE